jgi:S1-C subfamily serine protease
MKRFLFPLAILMASTQIAPAQETLPLETVQTLKKATVFIKVPLGSKLASGSGWVMKVEGDTAYLVTNHHVIADAPKRSVYPEVTVVFQSGTKEEQVVPAEVLASQRESDLAVLRVTGVKNLPKPIETAQPIELVETQPVVVFGFPFTGLDGEKNPPITVTKGAVSSIRTDGIVQLDTNLNPGNSGGPVVDTKGRLVGVVFARPQSGKEVITGIGLAIQPVELTRFLEGRVAESNIVSKTVMDGKAEIEIEVTLLDPLQRIRTIQVHSLMAEKLESDKLLAGMGGAQRLELVVKNQKARGKFMVETTKPGLVSCFCQASWDSSDGKKLAAKAVPFQINFTNKRAKKGDLVVFEKNYNHIDVLALSFSPSGKSLAVSVLSVVHLFDLGTGWKSVSLTEHKEKVYGIAYSLDGKVMATASEGHGAWTVCLRDASNGKVIQRLEDNTENRPNAVIGFSHDGRMLALGGTDEFFLLDAVTGQRLDRIRVPHAGYASSIRCLGFSPDGKLGATGGEDGNIRLWDVATRKEEASMHLNAGHPESLAWSPDGKTLAVGSSKGGIELWDVPSKKLRAELKAHREWVSGVCFNSDGTLLASCSWDHSTRLWHVASEREIATLDHNTFVGGSSFLCVAFSPNDQYLAMGNSGGRLFVLDVQQVLERFASKK